MSELRHHPESAEKPGRAGTPTGSGFGARLASTADALEHRLAEAERELPGLRLDQLEPCRLAALRLAHAAAALARLIHRAMGMPE